MSDSEVIALEDEEPVQKTEEEAPQNGEREKSKSSTRVVVKNMPYELKWQDIKDLFRKEVGDVAYVEMIEGNDGKPRGMAVIEFKDKDSSRKAIETMHQYKVNDRYLVVNEERDKDRRLFQQLGHMPGGGGRGGGGGGGMDMHVLAQLGIEGPISNTVFIANLDYKVGHHKLREVFKLAGNVIKAEIKEDKQGKSRGMGIVQFEHPMEAIQADEAMFNGQTLFDRKMIVRMDKVPEETQPQASKLPSGLKSIGMGLGVGGTPLTNISQISTMASSLGLGAGLGGGGLGGGLGTGAGLTGNMGLGMDAGLGVGGGLGAGAGLGGLSGLGAGGLGAGLGAGLGGTGALGLGGMGLGAGLGGMGAGGLGMSGDLPAGLGGVGKGLGGLGRVTRPDNCTVLVKNLPYAVTWQDLRERFQEIGEVKFAEIKMERGRSSGQGLVRFSNEDDAARAINNLDQTRFEGRTIEVRMYRG
ncbi:hypothetical protein BaRGS_00027636 [Batillaria attramentaria]|uniref:RRM domain-containing protein n=1 Tax=Batillaria attramentaria TaxID=370345 RepID=A0ABD0K2K1_9CAEN